MGRVNFYNVLGREEFRLLRLYSESGGLEASKSASTTKQIGFNLQVREDRLSNLK